MILSTGAKYIARSGGAWDQQAYVESIGRQKRYLDKLHQYDNDLICEACIFEHVSPAVNDIRIPGWVLEEFGLPVKGRNFSYKRMSPWWGPFRDHFGRGLSVPDIRRVETRMFFYYLACEHIDVGYEGLHLGQVHLTVIAMRHGRTGPRWWTGYEATPRSADATMCDQRPHRRHPGEAVFDFRPSCAAVRRRVRSPPATEEILRNLARGGLEKDDRNITYKDSIFTTAWGHRTERLGL